VLPSDIDTATDFTYLFCSPHPVNRQRLPNCLEIFVRSMRDVLLLAGVVFFTAFTQDVHIVISEFAFGE
jgi:hypothetical protein